MKTVTVSEFKAKCLPILDEVARTGEPVTILKRGKPVAQLIAPVQWGKGYPQEQIMGTVRIKGDIVEPPLPAEVWEAERQEQ